MNCADGISEIVPVSQEEGLFESGGYESPDKTYSLLRRVFTWNRPFFYGRFFMIVVQGARLAKKGKFTRQAWWNLSRQCMRMVENQGGRFEVTGLDNLRKHDGPAVFVSNHMSMLETVIFPSLLLKRSDICITLKKQLTELPIFGTLLSGFRNIADTRDKPMDDYKMVIREGGAALKEGYSMLIFPQSTRSVEFKPEEFNTAGVKLAAKAGVPIIPVALKTDFWKQGTLVKDLGPLDRTQRIHFAFGEPIPVESRNGKDENNRAIAFIQERLSEWQQ